MCVWATTVTVFGTDADAVLHAVPAMPRVRVVSPHGEDGRARLLSAARAAENAPCTAQRSACAAMGIPPHPAHCSRAQAAVAGPPNDPDRGRRPSQRIPPKR